jgi:outer membrane protein TolC
MWRWWSMALLLSVLPAHLYAEAPLYADEVARRARLYSPKILSALEKQNITTAKILEAEGAFDTSIEQSLYSRLNGFYDGQQADTRIVQPLRDFNAKISAGYRLSDGSFPVYEDQRITTDDGELLLGLQVSLLRNRAIDPKRLKLQDAELEQAIVDADVALLQVALQEQAVTYYWEWLAAGMVHHVYKDLLAIAEERQKNFVIRAEKGDIARIFVTENEQYILQRKTEVNNAERDVAIKANQLGFYARDGLGNPIIPTSDMMPTVFPPATHHIDMAAFKERLNLRPELVQFAVKEDQLALQERYGENLLLPQLDVKLEFSDDIAPGPPSREMSESIIKADVSIPFQRREAKGYIAQAKAQQRQLGYEVQLVRDSLNMKLHNALVALNAAEDYVAITKQEIELATTMQQAEKIRFDNGDSDFFLLNMRDENVAKARIKHIIAQQQYQQSLTQLYALNMDFSELCCGV